MNLIPLGNRLVVTQDEPTETTSAGLIIPDSSIEKPKTGIVVSAGPDVKTVATGDRVAYSEHAGSKITVDGESVFYIRESDVSFIIKP